MLTSDVCSSKQRHCRYGRKIWPMGDKPEECPGNNYGYDENQAGLSFYIVHVPTF
jgi:hypothetical protein